MRGSDTLALAVHALRAHRQRSLLSVLGIAIGIGAVTLLSSIGEGTRQYVLEQFTQFGTNLLAVTPGHTETLGVPGILGGTTHKLTLEDAEALVRVPGVLKTVPLVVGQARVEAGPKGRSVFVYGATADVPAVWKFEVGQGRFLPEGEVTRGAPVVVLGPTLKHELFGEANALGQVVRAADVRLRVVGVMAPKGRMLGFDVDDAAYVPVATALQMFNLEELTEIDVTFAEGWTDRVVEGIRATLMARHDGEEDFTVTTQAAMLETFDNVLLMLSWAVAAIAGISILVGAVGILTTMWIAVNERTQEIGLSRAIGATPWQVGRLFLSEAAILAVLGGALGAGGGLGLAFLVRAAVPGLPLEVSPVAFFAALGVSLMAGILSGFLPARRAALHNPLEALRAE